MKWKFEFAGPFRAMPFLLIICFLLSRYTTSFASGILPPNDSLEWKNAARDFLKKGDYQGASTALEGLQDLYLENEGWEGYLNTALERWGYLLRLKTSEGARNAADLLQSAFETAGPNMPPTDPLPWTASHKAGVAYFMAEDYPQSITSTALALEGREKNLEPDNSWELQGNLNIANCYYKMGQYRSALKYGTRALEFREGILREKTNELYTILARSYRETGDLRQASVYNGVLLSYYSQLEEEDMYRLAQFLIDLSIFHSKINQPDSSLYYASRSRDILLGMKEFYPEDSITLANAYHNMGDANVGLGNFPEGVENYKKTLEINSKLQGDSSLEVAHVYNNLGLAYYRLKDWDEAEDLLRRALAIKQRREAWKEDESSTWENLGDVYFARGDYEDALAAYQHSLVCHLPLFENTDVLVNPGIAESRLASSQTTILLLAAKANVLMAGYRRNGARDDLDLAYSTFQLVGKLIDDLRISFQADESKEFLVEKTRPIYESAIQACLDLHAIAASEEYLEQAFTYAERSKSIILLDAVRKANAEIFQGTKGGLLERERRAKSELSWLDRQVRAARFAGDNAEIARLSDKLLVSQLAYDRLLEEIQGEFPDYFALMHQVGTISPDEVRKELLEPGQAMLNYFVGQENIYVFYLRPEFMHVERLPRDSALGERIEIMRKGIYDPFTLAVSLSAEQKSQYEEQYAKQAYALYEMLLAPVSADGLPQELIIIPDDVLGYLPFEALLTTPAKRPGAYASMPFLLRQHNISYAYSATLLHEMRRKPSGRNSSGWLGLAPEFSEGNDFGLGPLHFNLDEVTRLQSIMGGDALFGHAATKSEFASIAPNYKVIHLSSHGRAHDLAPNDSSFIAFNARDGKEQLMFAWELYDLPLHADMVVLSVCETGLGKLQRGEGIISLARAFSYAGAKSVVTTLWKVNDQASSDLMVAYYNGLEDGLQKDEALANAKMGMLDQPSSAAPYYWAGFIATGDMSPLSGNSNYILILSLLAVGAAIFWFGWSKRKKFVHRD